MLRVGRISYLNVEPFFHAFPWPIAESLPPRVNTSSSAIPARLASGMTT